MASGSEPLYEYVPADEPKTDALATRDMSMMDVIALAVNRGAGVETVERLVALKRSVDKDRAEAEFNDALNKAQAEMEPVRKDLQNPQTSSKYASYPALNNALRPIYTKHGFSISYDTDVSPKGNDFIRVFAYCAKGSYTRTYKADMPCDGKGAKGNAVMTTTHAHGAAHMYGRRYLLGDIFDVVTTDGDTDGNEIPDWLTEYLDAMKDAADLDALKKLYFEAKAKAQRANSSVFVKMIEEAKDSRKAKLQ